MRFLLSVIFFVVLLSMYPCHSRTNSNNRRTLNFKPIRDIAAAVSPSSRWSLPFINRREPEIPKKRQVSNFNDDDNDDDSRIVFPTQRPKITTPKFRSTKIALTAASTTVRPNTLLPKRAELGGEGNQVPVSLFLELSNVTNPVDFLYRYVIEAPSDSGSLNSNVLKKDRNNSYGSSFIRERTLNAPFAHAAGCTPQPTTVPIEMNAEPYVMFFPSCTRIDRCDGCCNTDLLECTPTKTEMSRLQVLKVKYLGPDVNKFDVSEPIIIELEKHLQCDCQCRVKPSDCRFYQVYRPNECRCECTNQEDAATCKGDKFWDLNTCKCRCREHLDCSTGFFYNVDTCSCEVMRTSRFGNSPAFRGF